MVVTTVLGGISRIKVNGDRSVVVNGAPAVLVGREDRRASLICFTIHEPVPLAVQAVPTSSVHAAEALG